jgi:hypothetical protein
VEWFSFDGGLNSLAALAARLGKSKEYDVLSREWSGVGGPVLVRPRRALIAYLPPTAGRR